MDTNSAGSPQIASSETKRWYIIGGAIVGVLFVIAIIFFFLNKKISVFQGLFPQTPTLTVTPTPTPKPLICAGEYSFSVMGNSEKEPKIKSGKLNPCDPKQGSMQFLTVEFDSTTPVVSGNVVVTTDTKTQTVDMVKLEDGVSWKASWRMEDTYFKIYSIAIAGKTETSEKTTVLTFR